jgi:hypothetical protein
MRRERDGEKKKRERMTYHTTLLPPTQRGPAASNSGVVALCEPSDILSQSTRVNHPAIPLCVKRPGADNILFDTLIEQPRFLVAKRNLEPASHLASPRDVFDFSQDGLEKRGFARADSSLC